MATPAREKPLTVEEFDLLAEPIEGGKVELVDGRLARMTPVSGEHGALQARIAAALIAHADRERSGQVFVEAGFLLSRRPDVVRAPDVSFVAAERVPDRQARRRGSLHLAPDLAIEVTSPTDNDSDVHRKVEEYLAAGTPRVWVVRPEWRSVTIHRPGGDAHTYHAGDTLTSDDAGFGAPGFELDLAALFASIE